MIISSSKAVRWLLLAVLATFSPALLALGLGNATVESYLNQPLQVEIDLITRPEENLGEVSAGLAPAEDFALIGASREAISVPLRFAIQRDGEGAHIRVTSTLPVNDPIIRLVVEVNWPGGRMLREYTLFLDPPTVAAPAPPPVTAPRTDRATDRPTRPESAAAPPRDAGPVTEPVRPSVASVPEEGEYGPVQSGETLWRIATDWSSGTGMNVNQVMLAIQRNNPQAFINDNINLLKRGAILRMPRREDIEALSPAAARAEVIEQEAALESAIAPAPSAAVDTPLVDDSSDVADFEAPEPVAGPEAQLEIVPPAESEGRDSAYGSSGETEGAEASTDTASLREELTRTEEELISERQENEYLRERIAELEAQVASAPADGAAVDDPDLAAMEARLREDRLAAEDAPGETGPAAAAPARSDVPQVRTPPADEDKPWYRHGVVWLILVLVVALAGAGWYLSRRQSGDALAPEPGESADDTMRGITDEAEEILRTLGPGEREEAGDAAESESDEPGEAKRKTGSAPAADSGEAEFLDADSEDPEVRLDLARAYISMGDREAARVILAEVIEHGSEAQQAEARSMLKEL